MSLVISPFLELDTLATVTGRGATTSTALTAAQFIGNGGPTTQSYVTSTGSTTSQTIFNLLQNTTPYSGTNGAGTNASYGLLNSPQISNSGTGGSGSMVHYGIGNFPVFASSGTGAVVTAYGFFNQMLRNNASDVSASYGTLIGQYNQVGHQSLVASTAATVNIFANQSQGIANGGTSVGSLIQYYAVGNAVGSAINSAAGQTLTIGTYANFYAGVPTIGSTSPVVITNYYGVYLATPTVSTYGTITNRWGIYQADAAATNYFAGAIQQAGNQVLHAGNYNSYALPLSGGTLNGALTINAQLQALSASSGAIGVVSSSSSIIIGGSNATYAYGISTNNAGGLDIMSNQASQPVRIWAGGTPASPVQSASFNQSGLTVTGTISGSNLSGTNTGDNAVNSLYSGLVSNATHTGDVTGSTALTLATVNSNIGTFNNVTVNAKGLVTAASNVTYLTSLTDTLATVTARGATTATLSSFTNGVIIGADATLATNGYNISGNANGGAIEIRSNSGTTNRGWRIGTRDNGTGFTENISYLDSTGILKISTGDVTVAITLQSDYAVPTVIQRSAASGKSALIMRGSDTIGSAIESGRSQPATDWGTYLAFLVHDNNTSDALLSLKEKFRISGTGLTASSNMQFNANLLQFNNSGTRSWNMGVSGANLNIYSGDGLGALTFNSNIIVNAANISSYAVATITATTPIVASAATGAVTLSHAASGATAGTYNNVTVNATGHVTSGSNTAYLTAEADTLQTVTTRGSTTTTAITAGGLITAGQAGFSSASYVAGRNRIWSFANADSYGLSYFQSSGGYAGTTDMIGLHFGTATAAGSPFTFVSDGRFIATSTIAASNFSGSHSGTSSGTNTGDQTNITGTAATATSATYVNSPDGDRLSSTKLPTTNPRQVRFDFVGAGQGNGTGNYAGLMTYAPWDGTSASTGDSSYQLSFGNESGVNASGQPRLSIRNGINSTWNAWYILLHSGNYNSYSPTLTGGGASGTWGISISGSAATATDSTKLPLTGGTVSGVVRINNQLQVGQNTSGTAYIDAYGGYAWFGRDSNTAGIRIDGSGNVHMTGTLNAASTLSQGGNQVLHVANYNSYAPTLTGGSASGTWGINITGSAPWGNITSRPTSMMYYQGFTLDANTMDSNSTGFTYSVNAPWTGPIARFSAGGGYDLWLNANYSAGGNTLSFRTRNGDTAALNTWKTILHDGNYNSYAPTLTGTGASGTWGISITGSSASCTGNAATASSTPSATIASTVSTYNIAGGNTYVLLASAAGNGNAQSYYTNANIQFAPGTGTLSASILTATSDIRVKTNIKKIDNALEKVKQLRGVTYDRTDIEAPRQTGVIAQEVLEVLPEAVTGSEETQYGVAYGNMVGLLIEAIKDQQEIIDSQESRIARLEALVSKLIEG